MWSSNGNLDAGQGAKTSVSAPPPLYTCDIDWACSADIKGQVSGAGIATLQSLPGVPIGNANLMAPRGTINAGAAGIRVSGNLNLVAREVVNAFNIQVQGTAMGLPAAPPANIGALTTANNQAGAAAAQAMPPSQQSASQQPSIIIVEVLGFGGGDVSTPLPSKQEDERRNKASDQRSQNPNGSVLVVGVGDLTPQEKRMLTEEEKQNLVQ